MIEIRKNTRYEIMTPDGYKPFSAIKKTSKSEVIHFILSNSVEIQSSLDHRFIVDGLEVLAKNIKPGDILQKDVTVVSIEKIEGDFILYDPVDVGTKHLFIADKLVSHNCDFLASGDTVFEPDDLLFYEQTYQRDPVEKRGVDSNLWIWESPDYTKDYIVVADVSRGDSADYSAFHIFDVETCTQVGEYKGKVSPKDFGNVLVGIATEYNEALLVIENANIGWATIEQVMEREYRNLYYSSTGNMETVESYMSKYERDKLVPGFTMSMKTRPLVIAKMTEYIRERAVIIQSKRTMGEMRVFVWKNGKPQAQTNYNDDLIISCAIALYVRDTALRLRQQGMDLTRAQMSSFSNLNTQNRVVMSSVGNQRENPYIIKTAYGDEDITWLL